MRNFMFMVALALACAAGAAHGRPLPPGEDYVLVVMFANAQKIILSNKDRYQEAIGQCGKAEKLVAQYDRDPFIDAQIAQCYGDVEFVLNNKQAACNHYARAIRQFRAVPARHREYHYAVEFSNDSRKRRKKLGC
jgi:hypothetical protein